MNDFRNGQNLDGDHLKAARKRYCAMAKEWTRHHADRLGVAEFEVLAAIRRTWLPEDIESLPANMVSYLSRSPVVAALAKEPVFPLVRDGENHGRRREQQVAGVLKGMKAA